MACREWAEKVQTLSGERVRVEVFCTLMATDPADVFQLMRDWRVLEHVLPEADDVARLKMLSWLDSRALRLDSVAPDPVRRLAALLAPDHAEAEVVGQRLRLSTHQKDRLTVMLRRPYPVDPDGGPHAATRALYHLGTEAVRDLALLGWAGELAFAARSERRAKRRLDGAAARDRCLAADRVSAEGTRTRSPSAFLPARAWERCCAASSSGGRSATIAPVATSACGVCGS